MRDTSAVPIFCLSVCLGVVSTQSAGTAAVAEVILRAADAPIIRGTWTVVADSSAAGGSRIANPNRGLPKPSAPLPAPENYFELTFDADAGRPYHLWLRGKAQDDNYENDSVWVQFSDSVTAAGAATWRIGSTSAPSVVLEDCSGCGVFGWGWQDNAYGGFGTPVYFAGSGTHTMRIQVREDGLSIDQIVLSAVTYFSNAPGPTKNDNTLLVGGGSPPPTVSLLRSPYLHQMRDDSVVIVWASRQPGPARAQVGSQMFNAATTFFAASQTGIGDYFQHEARISGLAPATNYTYRLFVGGAAATSGSDLLTTAPAPGTGSVRFIVFGDSGTGSVQQVTLASLMNADAFDFVLHAGDIAYGNSGGTGDASHATYQSWFFDIYSNWLRRRAFFPSIGNHDARPSNNWGQAYLDVFALPEDAGAGPYADHAERYYSFDYGPVHVAVLDTELAFQDPSRRAVQLAWLDADLAAASQPWKIALFHRSPYSSGGGHGSDLAVRQAFGPVFEKRGVQLSLSAHEHAYERSVPWRTGTATGSQAVTYIVTGGGGGPLYANGQDAWTAVSASRHHYARLNISGCLATLETVAITGSVFDSHVLDRCAQAADASPPAVSFVSPLPNASVSGLTTVEATAADDVRVEKVDLWIDGTLHAIDTASPYRFTWDTAAAATGAHTLELRAHDIGGHRTSQTETVTVVPQGSGPPLPQGWTSGDIGTVGVAGSASESGGTFTVSGAGADVWGTTDAFHSVWRKLDGNGELVARVVSVNGTHRWTKVGVMMRATLDADSAHGFMLVSAARGLAFQRRTVTGGLSTNTSMEGAAPHWVKLARTGGVIAASVSNDGVTWTEVGSDAFPAAGSAWVGLAVTSHDSSQLATGTFDNVRLTPTP